MKGPKTRTGNMNAATMDKMIAAAMKIIPLDGVEWVDVHYQNGGLCHYHVHGLKPQQIVAHSCPNVGKHVSPLPGGVEKTAT